MKEIRFQKQHDINENCVRVRVAEDVNQRLSFLASETGMTKQCITDKLLRFALDAVVIEGTDDDEG